MALGKIRSSRRSSSSTSYKSTITTLVFVTLCVIGLWMLTSSSVKTNTTSRSSTSSYSSVVSNFIKPIRQKEKEDSTPYEDTQGDLPDDAVKGDRGGEDVKKQQVKEIDKTNLLDRSRDPETTATAEQVPDEHDKGVSITKNQESKEQEEHDNQVVEENSRNADIAAETKIKEEAELQQQEQQQREQQQQQQQQQLEQETIQETQHKEEPQHEITEVENQQQNQQIQEQAQVQAEAENQQNQQIQEETHAQAQAQAQAEQDSQEKMQQMQQETHLENNENVAMQTNVQPIETQAEAQTQTQAQIQDNAQQIQQETQTQTQDTQDLTQAQQVVEPVTEVVSKPILDQIEQDTKSKEERINTNVALEGAQSGIPKESKESKAEWSTQAHESENQKDRKTVIEYKWEVCNVTAGADYIPCLDNEEALKLVHNTGHYEHRERHCPAEGPSCLVSLPPGYKRSVEWPSSRDKIWYHNVPHTKLAEVKGHQNWVKVTGEFLTFPGGGTQFIHGALHYIDFLQKSQPNIAWGKHTRVILDVGCGVASFGGFLFERDVLAMSFAPKDEHEAQVQFALERGIPAISAVMGTQRLPFPSIVFDLVHCARCRVPWHIEGGMLLLELNRVLRPGGYFVWSATPVYQKLPEDVQIWKEMSVLTKRMCWELVTIQKDRLNSVGAAIYRKPTTNDCYAQRKHKSPPMCKPNDDPNAAWYVPLQPCMHMVPVEEAVRGAQWPTNWPERVHTPPYWLSSSQKGIYGKPAPEDFQADYEHWKQVVTKTYMSGLQISWSNVRNVMDMRAVYGGFAAALKDLKVWVMNVVGVNGPDTLPIIYERGLFGIYHNWCESFSTYPRSYDLLHADHLFSGLKQRCKLLPVIVEVDRIVRPGGKFIARDDPKILTEIEDILKSLHWEIHLTFAKGDEGILSAQKSDWRPETALSSS